MNRNEESVGRGLRDSGVPREQVCITTKFLPRQTGVLPGSRRQKGVIHMTSEHVLDVPVRRYVIESDRPFSAVMDGIFAGISQPDVSALFASLAASTSYEQFSSLVREAQGSIGLMRFLQLDLDHALTIDPQAPDWSGRRLVRLIAGNPVTMGTMTRHVAAAGSYAPITILVEETPGGGTRVAYDSIASAISPYGDPEASEVARQLDTEVLGLLRGAAGAESPATR